jgi:hypothetical protein
MPSYARERICWDADSHGMPHNFGKNEPMLQSLSRKPSDFVRRQVKFTPFPFEDVGWLVEQ